MHKVVIAVALASALTSQQQQPRDLPPTTPGTGRIAGTVVDAESGRSVRFARVTLMSSMEDREAVTDEGGAFSFDSLKAGSYRLQVSKLGYLETAYGQARPGTDTPGKHIVLAGRTAVVTIVVPLSHGGAISGVVRDERGDPAFRAMVTVSRWICSCRSWRSDA
jgi:Carboxypeptidase regulatory-like domain